MATMSTCSTATSAHRGRHESQRRRAPPAPAACDAGVVKAVGGRLERRLVDLERDWDTYKTGRRSDAPPHRHRRSRSATATPSSAVTVAAVAPEGLLLALHRCSSPRTLLSSLQQADSTYSGDDDCAADNIILSGAAADSPAAGSCQGGFSSVCSVEGGYSVAASSTPSCPSCRCAACCGYSASYSSGTGATAPSFSPAARVTVGENARNKSDGGRSVASRAAWISAIALVAVGLVVMVIVELRVDQGCAEYLVPT